MQVPSAGAFAQFSLRNFYNLPFELIWNGLRNTLVLMILVPTLTLTVSVADFVGGAALEFSISKRL